MESETIFDRTAGDRFDYSQGICGLCGITREEFKDNDYPKCTGGHTEARASAKSSGSSSSGSRIGNYQREIITLRPVLQLERVPCLLQ
jgi:hypothetical protein